MDSETWCLGNRSPKCRSQRLEGLQWRLRRIPRRVIPCQPPHRQFQPPLRRSQLIPPAQWAKFPIRHNLPGGHDIPSRSHNPGCPADSGQYKRRIVICGRPHHLPPHYLSSNKVLRTMVRVQLKNRYRRTLGTYSGEVPKALPRQTEAKLQLLVGVFA